MIALMQNVNAYFVKMQHLQRNIVKYNNEKMMQYHYKQ